MRIAKKYSHINGEEFLLVHHKKEYKQIKDIIASIDAKKHKRKAPKLKNGVERVFYNPYTLSNEIKTKLYTMGWRKERFDFATSREIEFINKNDHNIVNEQREYWETREQPSYSFYNQIDFIKNKISLEIQLDQRIAVMHDLFVKHFSFYNQQLINLGVEIIPTKAMQQEMPSESPWFEKEVHNVMRHGRTNPTVPLLILGIEP